MKTPLSILDLAPVGEGDTASAAVRRTVELARLGERLGYVRHWFAEHHSMPSVASSAPEILIAHVAAATQRIRVGAGGIMLPNHRPLRVAEMFHTLSALHPGRIDLGIGRAPGADPATARALQAGNGSLIGQMLGELHAFSANAHPDTSRFYGIHAEPADAPLPPIWLLGSSGASARMAAAAGLGYSFAAHFSTTPAAPALAQYRAHFRPSPAFPTAHTILGVSAVCADSEAEAQRLATSMELAWLRFQRNQFLPLPSPETASAHPYSDDDIRALQQHRALTIVGTPEQVRAQIQTAVSDSGADEVMIVSNIHDPRARLRSYELIAQAFAADPDNAA